jgi:hypothetical protein
MRLKGMLSQISILKFVVELLGLIVLDILYTLWLDGTIARKARGRFTHLIS